MSALGAMAALGGQLTVCPHNSYTWRWSKGDGAECTASTSGVLSVSWSLSNPGIQLRRLKHGQSSGRRKQAVPTKCIALAEEQVKVLDAEGGGNSKNPSSSAGKKDEAESMPLLKPSPKPMMPPPRPKPVMPEPNGSNGSQARRPATGSFSQVYRPKEQAAPGPVQNLDKILENAEKLGSANSPRPMMRRQDSSQQPTSQQPSRPQSFQPWRPQSVQQPSSQQQSFQQPTSQQPSRPQSFQQPASQQPSRPQSFQQPASQPPSRPQAFQQPTSEQPSRPQSVQQPTSQQPSRPQSFQQPTSQQPPRPQSFQQPTSQQPSRPQSFQQPTSQQPSRPQSFQQPTSQQPTQQPSRPQPFQQPTSQQPSRPQAFQQPQPLRPQSFQQPTSQQPLRPQPFQRPTSQQSFQQPTSQEPSFRTKWKRGDPISPIDRGNGTATVKTDMKVDSSANGRPLGPAKETDSPLKVDSSASVKPLVTELPKPAQQVKTDLSASKENPGVQAPRSPVLNSPPLMKPKPVQPQMLAKPTIAPKPAPPPAMPAQARGPRLVDTFRKAVDPSAVATKSTIDEPKKKQPVLKDVGAGATAGAPPKLAVKDEKRKKAEIMDGAKRRMVARDENAMDDAEEIGVNISGVSAGRKGRKYNKARRKAERAEAAKASAPVKVDILEVGKQGMSVADLASRLAVHDADVVKVLFMKGIPVTVNQTLDEESVKIVCNEYEVEVIEAGSVRVDEMAKKQKEFLDEEDLESLERRPPVVTVMGHVDHGKTSLLDYIRKSKVAAGEAGGITQAIGAYQVLVNVDGEDQPCVFLDTPGHQAFSAMRARGARVTDVAIIVVAADDGTRPQTLEAIAHAKAANVPIVVAISKIDKPGANVDRVKEELSKVGVVPPEWGGEEQMIPVSAITGDNIDQLLETVMLVAELQDLKANPNRKASGTVIEASLGKTRGPLATLLIQNGTLKKGDVVLCGESYGKVRALFNDSGQSVSEARPSAAVQVTGLSSVPVAGDEFEILDTIDEARERAAEHAERIREARLASQASEGKVTLASLASAVASSKETGVESCQLNVVLKVDVQGTVEAIREALQVLPQDTVQLRFLMQAAGDITTSDIDLAIASGAIVIGFNVRLQPNVKERAEAEGVEIRQYKVIYDLIDDMRQAMEGLLTPIEEELPIGKAEVRATFTSGSGRVGGCMVVEGKLVKGCGVHVKRNKKIVHTGKLSSLRRVKEAAKEVEAGLECGVGIDDFNEWQEGDTVHAFNKVQKKRTLEDASASVAAVLSTKE